MLLGAVLVLAACQPPAVLTADGDDTYKFTSGPTPDTMQVSAPTSNTDSNLRMVWWDPDSKEVIDGTSCATWSTQSNVGDQQGVALRISFNFPDHQVHAVTVTKNIWLGAVWIFNAHVWDGPQLSTIGGVNLQSVFDPSGDPAMPLPLPWNICARTTGNTLSFIAWPSAEPQPAWGDTTHGGSWTLPTGWSYKGYSGSYVGHLRPGDRALYTNLKTSDGPGGSIATHYVRDRRWPAAMSSSRSDQSSGLSSTT